MEKTAKIYISGHRGLVGSAIKRHLEQQGYENILIRTSKDLDLRRQADTEAFFGNTQPEYVFLAAARVGGILANSAYPANFIYDNLMIQNNVIDAAYRYGVKKLLFLGSSCIYPKFAPHARHTGGNTAATLSPSCQPISMVPGITLTWRLPMPCQL